MSSRPYQFSLRRLLFLNTAIAIALAVASSIEAPNVVRIGLGLFLAAEIAWYVMRWSPMKNNWQAIRRQRLAAIQHRREMAIEAARRNQRTAAISDGNQPQRRVTE